MNRKQALDQLGLGENATEADINKARKTIASSLHPDRAKDDFQRDLYNKIMQRVNTAADFLTHVCPSGRHACPKDDTSNGNGNGGSSGMGDFFRQAQAEAATRTERAKARKKEAEADKAEAERKKRDTQKAREKDAKRQREKAQVKQLEAQKEQLPYWEQFAIKLSDRVGIVDFPNLRWSNTTVSSDVWNSFESEETLGDRYSTRSMRGWFNFFGGHETKSVDGIDTSWGSPIFGGSPGNPADVVFDSLSDFAVSGKPRRPTKDDVCSVCSTGGFWSLYICSKCTNKRNWKQTSIPDPRTMPDMNKGWKVRMPGWLDGKHHGMKERDDLLGVFFDDDLTNYRRDAASYKYP